MSDAQDESVAEQATAATDAVEEDMLMDEVAEARPVSSKKSGFTGFLVVLVLLGGAAGAGWYYQAMWLPQVQDGAKQAQEKVQQAQAWLDDLLSFGKGHDRMAAPMPKAESPETAEESSKPNYVVSAISDPEPVVEKVMGNSHAAKNEAVVAEQVAEVNEVSTGVEKKEMLAMVEPVVEAPVITTEESMVTQLAESEGSASMTEMPAVQPPAATKRNAVNLTDARQAFWQRDLPKAEALYKEQINSSEADADSWGELGNIYYFQAKWRQAASAYTEAALILLDKGDFPQAMFLRYIVIGLDPVQARRIDERVQALQAPLHG